MSVRSYTSLGCCGCALVLLFSLGAAIGWVFLSFWVGWRVQLAEFVAQNSTLVNYQALFAVPPVAPAWPVFSCFLYGFLILKACALALGLLIWLICICGVGGTVCCCANPSERAEEMMPLNPWQSHQSRGFIAKAERGMSW